MSSKQNPTKPAAKITIKKEPTWHEAASEWASGLFEDEPAKKPVAAKPAAKKPAAKKEESMWEQIKDFAKTADIVLTANPMTRGNYQAAKVLAVPVAAVGAAVVAPEAALVVGGAVVVGAVMSSCSSKKDAPIPLADPSKAHGQVVVYYGEVNAGVAAQLDQFGIAVIEPGHTPVDLVTQGLLKKNKTLAYVSVGGLNTDNWDPDLKALDQKLMNIKPDAKGHSGYLRKTDGSVQSRYDVNNVKMFDWRNEEAKKLILDFYRDKANKYGGLFLDEPDYQVYMESDNYKNDKKGNYKGVTDAMADAIGTITNEYKNKVILNGGVQERTDGGKSLNKLTADLPLFGNAKESSLGFKGANGTVVPWSPEESNWVKGRLIDQVKEAAAAKRPNFRLILVEPYIGYDAKALAEYSKKLESFAAEVRGAAGNMPVEVYTYFSNMSFTDPKAFQLNKDLSKERAAMGMAPQASLRVASTALDPTKTIQVATGGANSHSFTPTPALLRATSQELFDYLEKVPALAKNPEALNKAIDIAANKLSIYTTGYDDTGRKVTAADGKLSKEEIAATLEAVKQKFPGALTDVNEVATAVISGGSAKAKSFQK